jgi:macrolide-specific efflux system membrane fusion protein
MDAFVLILLSAALGQGAGASDRLEVESALVSLLEEVDVPAQVEGVLADLDAREGRLVEAGANLARIEDGEVRLTHERARIEYEIARKQAQNDLKLKSAKKSAEVARTELKRAVESVEKYKKSVSETELDRLRLALDRAELDVEQAVHDRETALLTSQLKETEMRLAQHAIDRRAIVSPISGMIVQVNVHRGEWVQPGKAVLRVLRVDRLRIEGFVPAKKLTEDIVGRRATFTADLPGRAATEFEGAVVFVNPEVNPVNGQVRVWAEVENKKLLLRPGMRGSLTIHPETAQTAKNVK